MTPADGSKPPLDETTGRLWNAIRQPWLSEDGSRVLYVLSGPGGPSLRILNLDDRSEETIDGIDGYDAASGWLFYMRADADSSRESGTLVARELATDRKRTFPGVVDFAQAADAGRLAFHAVGEHPGVFLADLEQGRTERILDDPGPFGPIAIDRSGQRVAVTAEVQDGTQDGPFLWQADRGKAERTSVLPAGLPDGWSFDTGAELRFSATGRRLFAFLLPPSEPEDDGPIEIWRWNDPLLPSERESAARSRAASRPTVLHLATGKAVLLQGQDLQKLDLAGDGEADFAVGSTEQPYALQRMWEEPPRCDFVLVNLESGESQVLCRGIQGTCTLSPDSRFALSWNAERRAWSTIELASKQERDLTGSLPVAFHDEQYDHPGPPPSYGVAGWLADDARVLLYDRYDLWSLDPRGEAEPVNLTAGSGRQESMRFRRADDEHGALPADRDGLLLLGFDERTKATGFFRLGLAGDGPPRRLIQLDRALSLVGSGEGAQGRHLFRRSSVEEHPDLWIADRDFVGTRRLTEANPQQHDYRWATAELIEWQLPNGEPNRGILFKPEGYEPGVRLPLVVFLYERSSDGLHQHFSPRILPPPVIQMLIYASRGYLVFVPDVSYRIGAPGRSSLDATVSGVRHLIDAGLVDAQRIGANSHSWGGYELAFMATRTDLFRAIAAGAPVSNMTSAYCELRGRDGRSRMFEYEQYQSRIGGTLWNSQEAFLDNSPLFAADRITTPMLILHNDHDDVVPWTEGIQLFLALRRLGRPCWLVNYRNERHMRMHPPSEMDWAVRLRSFFDHFLLDAPAPGWLGKNPS